MRKVFLSTIPLLLKEPEMFICKFMFCAVESLISVWSHCLLDSFVFQIFVTSKFRIVQKCSLSTKIIMHVVVKL